MANFFANYPIDGGGGSFTAANLTDAGTDGIVITGGTGAVNGSGTSIAQHVADSTHNGYLSSADWVIFNAKQAALTIGNLTDAGTDGITVTGGTGAVIGSGTSLSQRVADSTHNGYLSSTDWSTFNAKQAALTIGNLTAAGTDGIVVTSGTGAVIGSGTSLAQHVADSTHNGYLLSTDWVLFNAKQSTALTSAHILVGNVSNVATDVAMSGDIAINNAGATSYSGTVPLNKGGTGQTTKAPAFDALSPMTTAGDLILGGTAGTGTRLAIGSNTFVLTSNGTTASWAAAATTALATPSVAGTTTSFTPTIKSSTLTTTNANYAVLDTDGFELFLFSTGNTNRTLTVPNPANNTGRRLIIKKTDSGTGKVTVTAFSAEKFDAFSSYLLPQQYDMVAIESDGTNWFITKQYSTTATQSITLTPNASFGTVSSTSYKYERVGSWMNLHVYFKFGTVTGAAMAVALPSGFTINYSSLTTTTNASMLGTCYGLDTASTGFGTANVSGGVFADGSDTGNLYFAFSGASSAFEKSTANNLVNTAGLAFACRIPITEWTQT